MVTFTDGISRIYNKLRWNSKLTRLLHNSKRQTVSAYPRITLSMCVKNEASAYLSEMLTSCTGYIDNAVIIDDASTDNTVEICEEILKDTEHVIIKNNSSIFANEWKLRKQQWEETVKTNPDWILFLDADEIFESCFKSKIRELLRSDPSVYVYEFRRYDLWDNSHYRDDNLWTAHLHYDAFMLRYDPTYKYIFARQTNQHCGRMPSNIKYMKARHSELRLKHYGWINEEKRLEKYKRYMLLDPDGLYGSLQQYQSILDKNPHLVEWKE